MNKQMKCCGGTHLQDDGGHQDCAEEFYRHSDRFLWEWQENSQWVPCATTSIYIYEYDSINPLKPELNPICYLLALLAHHFLHVSRIRVKSLTIRLLMSYIYDISRLRVKDKFVTYSWLTCCSLRLLFQNSTVSFRVLCNSCTGIAGRWSSGSSRYFVLHYEGT